MNKVGTAGHHAEDSTGGAGSTELIETSIGDAVVYFRVDRRLDVTEAEGIRPVAAPLVSLNPVESAMKVARETVRLFAGHLAEIAEALRPTETALEFSLTFEAKGKHSIVPVFLTGEVSGEAVLKVKAKWSGHANPQKSTPN